MWFAIYLYEKGIITGDEFAEAVSVQISRRMPLGKLAIEQGTLSLSEVMKILKVQADEPENSFGGIAQQLSFLTKEQVDLLLVVQEQRVTPISKILVERGYLRPTQLVDEMQASRRSQAGSKRVAVETHA